MKLLAWRLVLTASLFIAWLGYLGYLVATRPLTASYTPLVLSRPQILVSPIDVVAEVSAVGAPVTIEEVLYPADAPLRAGQKITVLDLDACRPPSRRDQTRPWPDDFTGSGRYLISLRPSAREQGAYEVVPIPASPGFDGILSVRIYPYTDETAAQYRRIEKPPVP